MKLMTLLLLLATSNLKATQSNIETLLVSINKAGTSPSKIESALRNLNFRELNTDSCFVYADVVNYIKYRNAPYYGVAFVNFEWNCDYYAHTLLTKWQNDTKYTIWSNDRIGPYPAISENN